MFSYPRLLLLGLLAGGLTWLVTPSKTRLGRDGVPSGNLRENALAERVNGVLKDEYLYNCSPENIKQAKQIPHQTISLYNSERPHMSIGNLVSEKVHELNLNTGQLWKSCNKKKNIIVKQ